MAVRRILLLGEEALRDPGVEVEAFDDELRALVEDLLETMYFAEGIGLAAPQIGVSRRVCVLDLRDEDDPEGGRWGFVNPVNSASSGEEGKAPEGFRGTPWRGGCGRPSLRWTGQLRAVSKSRSAPA